MRYDEGRYGGDDYVLTRRQLTPDQFTQIQTGLVSALASVKLYGQLTADQNDFKLAVEFVIHRFTSDASRTITGFANVDAGPTLKVVVNGGAQDVVLANDSGSSAAGNRILTHSGANITLSPGNMALIYYDTVSARVRAGKLT